MHRKTRTLVSLFMLMSTFQFILLPGIPSASAANPTIAQLTTVPSAIDSATDYVKIIKETAISKGNWEEFSSLAEEETNPELNRYYDLTSRQRSIISLLAQCRIIFYIKNTC